MTVETVDVVLAEVRELLSAEQFAEAEVLLAWMKEVGFVG